MSPNFEWLAEKKLKKLGRIKTNFIAKIGTKITDSKMFYQPEMGKNVHLHFYLLYYITMEIQV